MKKRLMLAFFAVVLMSSFTHAEVRTKATSITKAKEFMKAQMYDRAVPILNGLVEESPANTEYHLLLAQCYLKLNNMQGADNEFERVVAVDSSQSRKIGDIFKEQGYSRLSKKDYSSASFPLLKAASSM